MGASWILFATVLGIQAKGQSEVPRFTLGQAAGGPVGDFTAIESVRELPNGRALISSQGHATPVEVDFLTGNLDPVGRVGAGPGEYREVRAIFALAGDSSLVIDQRNLRWSVLVGTVVVRTSPTWLVGWIGPRFAGVDQFGGVLELRPTKFGTQPGVLVNQFPENAETLAVIRHVRSAKPGPAVERSDTVAFIRGAFGGVRRVIRTLGKEQGQAVGVWYELRSILRGEDQAILFPDGWIAIAYQEPYHVRWRSPDGPWRVGGPLPVVRVAVDELQKKAAVRRDHPRAPRDMFSPRDYPSWPQVLPPFLSKALIPMPDGRLAIRRTPNARVDLTEYDLVDRTGLLTARLTMKSNERLVAFSANWVYVVTRDEDDLDWLRRHPWPAGLQRP